MMNSFGLWQERSGVVAVVHAILRQLSSVLAQPAGARPRPLAHQDSGDGCIIRVRLRQRARSGAPGAIAVLRYLAYCLEN
eukprot:2292766-Pleurochrysis_carterae.AAC.5